MNRALVVTVAVRVLRVALGLASSLISARLLGPAGRGEYFYIATLASLVVQFGNLGLHASNTFYVARDKGLLPRLFANSFWVALVIGGAGGSAVAIAVSLLLGTRWELLRYVPLLAVPALFYLLGSNLLIGTRRVMLFNAFELTSSALIVVALSAAALLGAGVDGFLATSTLAWFVTGSTMFLVIMRISGATLAFDRSVFARAFRYAARAYTLAFLAFLVLRGNVFLLERLAGSTELGVYSVAAQVGDLLGIVPGSVALILFPQLVHESAGIWPRTIRAAIRTGAITACLSFIVALGSGPLVQLLFGREFAAASAVIVALLPGVVALAMVTVISQYLAAIGFPTELFGSWAASLLLMFAISAVAIPSLGAFGAAIALSVAYVVLLALVAATAWRHARDGELPRPVDAREWAEPLT